MESLVELMVQHGVPLVALLVLLGQLGLPTGVSTEVALLLTGAYAVHSAGGLAGAVALVVVADLIGALGLFLAVRRGSRWFAARRGGNGAVRERRGGTDVLLLACRVLPFARMPATIAAGAMRLPTRRFLAGSAMAAPLWGGAPLATGYWLGDDVRALSASLDGAAAALVWALPASALLLGMVRRARGTTPHPDVLGTLAPGRSAYGAVPVATGNSAWLLHSAQEPVKRRTLG